MAGLHGSVLVVLWIKDYNARLSELAKIEFEGAYQVQSHFDGGKANHQLHNCSRYAFQSFPKQQP